MKQRWLLRRAKTLKRNDVIWDPDSGREIYVTMAKTVTSYCISSPTGVAALVVFDGIRTDNVMLTGAAVTADRYLIVKLPAPPKAPEPPPIRYVRDHGNGSSKKLREALWSRFKELINGG